MGFSKNKFLGGFCGQYLKVYRVSVTRGHSYRMLEHISAQCLFYVERVITHDPTPPPFPENYNQAEN